MRNFLRLLAGGGDDQRTARPQQFIAIEKLAHQEIFWGPFTDVDEIITFCEHTGAVVSVTPLNDPHVGLMQR